jgi:hypothetical protein
MYIQKHMYRLSSQKKHGRNIKSQAHGSLSLLTYQNKHNINILNTFLYIVHIVFTMLTSSSPLQLIYVLDR